MQVPAPAPTAQGSFAKTPFPHLLVYALERALTGTFELHVPSRGAESVATMLFVQGVPAKVRTTDGVHYLGSGVDPGYAVLNLNVDFRPTPQWSFFVLITNVFDRRYSTAAQLGATAFDANGAFRARPFPANASGDYPRQDATFYSPGAPRAFVVGMKYALAD